MDHHLQKKKEKIRKLSIILIWLHWIKSRGKTTMIIVCKWRSKVITHAYLTVNNNNYCFYFNLNKQQAFLYQDTSCPTSNNFIYMPERNIISICSVFVLSLSYYICVKTHPTYCVNYFIHVSFTFNFLFVKKYKVT